MEYKKQIWCNNHDVRLAMTEGCRPMQHNIDWNARIPYFINLLKDGRFDNYHHKSYSAAHIPGRWLGPLLRAKHEHGVAVDEDIVNLLAECTYWIFDDKAGLPLSLDLDTMRPTNMADLHNLREYMHALYALMRYRADDRAHNIAMRMMGTVNKYFDASCNIWRAVDYEKDTGIKTYTAPIKAQDTKKYYLPSSFGRYIEPLVKLYAHCGIKEAMDQAVLLKECVLKYALRGENWYTPDKLGAHIHSITSMISSLALFSKHNYDIDAMAAAEKFLCTAENDAFLDFGWSIENLYSTGISGEINNTSDLVKTYLLMGEKQNKKHYHKAERMVRGHFLPAQLLDDELLSTSVSGEGEPYMKGAFGFPTPYGHEVSPGKNICYNWDITGGGVDGLLEVMHHTATENGDITEINMLFGCDTGNVRITDPYINNNVLVINNYSGANRRIKVNLSDTLKVETIIGATPEQYVFDNEGINFHDSSHEIKVVLSMDKKIKDYHFRDKLIRMEWTGDMISAANRDVGRLRFFKTFDE